MRKGTLPRGSRDRPEESRRTECSRPSLLRRQHATSVLSYREAACPELNCSANGRNAIMPSSVFSPCCQTPVRNSLVLSRAQACDAPRHGGTTSLPSGIGCAAVLLGPRLCSASAAGNQLVRHTVRVALAAILTVVRTPCACVPSGDWNMNWPFTPCVPDSAIRDCLPGMAPGPVGVLNVFHRLLAPAARTERLSIPPSPTAACEVPGKRGTPLPSANAGRTHAAQGELPARPAALCPARGERRTGPPSPSPFSRRPDRHLDCIRHR
ncbi:exo-alpha-sialidase [Trypanosoma cruzi]|nr:exo-alpha-sialidase [Trypanosoma cruzi]